ncbi:MAG: hypothetical protein ACFCGT_03885 [Sandaracinaceae bacterium]
MRVGEPASTRPPTARLRRAAATVALGGVLAALGGCQIAVRRSAERAQDSLESIAAEIGVALLLGQDARATDDPADAARAATESLARAEPPGCAAGEAHGPRVTTSLERCLVPGFPAELSGDVVGLFVASPAGTVLDLGADGLAYGQGEVSFETRVHVPPTGSTVPVLRVDGLATGVGPRRHAFRRSGGSRVVGGGERCALTDGEWRVSTGDTTWTLGLDGVTSCRGACYDAPAPATFDGPRGGVRLLFDGSRDVRFADVRTGAVEGSFAATCPSLEE